MINAAELSLILVAAVLDVALVGRVTNGPVEEG